VVPGPSGRHQCQGHRPKSKGTVKAKEGPAYAIVNSLDSSPSRAAALFRGVSKIRTASGAPDGRPKSKGVCEIQCD
jgi:hypothetical protein